jgi:serine/threonine protein kinase
MRQHPRPSPSPAMMTGVGVLLGTAAYMSPEQARGKAVDKRSDIWAFGCVLYEMLTGKRAFAGDEVSDVLASVLAREPDWTLLPPGLSPVIATYIKRCLHKDRRQRIGDAQSLRLSLEGAFETSAPPRWPARVDRAVGLDQCGSCRQIYSGRIEQPRQPFLGKCQRNRRGPNAGTSQNPRVVGSHLR